MYVCVGHASGMCCVSLIVTYIRVCIICIDCGARPNALACIFLVVDMHCTTCENESKGHSKRAAIVQLEWDLSLDLYHMYIVYIHVCALYMTLLWCITLQAVTVSTLVLLLQCLQGQLFKEGPTTQ